MIPPVRAIAFMNDQALYWADRGREKNGDELRHCLDNVINCQDVAAYIAAVMVPQQRFSLTPLQKKVYDYIAGYIGAQGIGPTFQEIADALGLPSKSAVYRLVRALRERGHINFMDNRSRTITLTLATA